MLTFFLGVLLGVLLGGTLRVTYLHQETTTDIGPDYKRVEYQPDTIETPSPRAMLRVSWRNMMTADLDRRRAAGHPDPVSQWPTTGIGGLRARDRAVTALYDDGMADALFGEPRLAAIYDAVEGERRADLDHYLAIADEFGARSLLDVGCGTGILARRAANQGMDVTGVDPAAASLDVARAKPGAAKVRWLHGDATGLPELQVDLATMTANVAHVFLTDEDWAATLRGVYAALRPGGHLVFEVRDPARRPWERWTRENTYRSFDVSGTGVVETWWDVTEVDGALVSYRRTYVFAADGTTLTSDSTRRFWSRKEIEDSLRSAGYALAEVRDAPDRPGWEWVFIARKP